MAVSFTPDQEQVISLRDCDILVSAAAGSGKTAVLVERIVQMVCDESKPVDIDRLLIVTFTKAAAAEMRERIGAELSKRVRANPESEHIRRQETLLHNALITTIDSFSLYIVKNHFQEIQLDPAFRVADDGEIKLLGKQIMGEVLEAFYEGRDAAFLECVAFFCPEKTDEAIETLIEKLENQASSTPFPIEWLLERKKDYQSTSFQEYLSSDAAVFLMKHSKELLQAAYAAAVKTVELCELPHGAKCYREALVSDVIKISELLEINDIERLAKAVGELELDKLGKIKFPEDDPQIKEIIKEIRKNSVKDTIELCRENLFGVDLQRNYERSLECSRHIVTLLDVTIAYMDALQEEKKRRKIIDFSDMEHYALEILLKKEGDYYVPTQVAKEYREYFAEVFTDEYQDSNLVQEYLLNAVSSSADGKFNRFMVGDIKQSIYRFRMARPELFLEKYNAFQKEGNQRRIDLSKNFRSRKEVVDTVNQIFSRVMKKQTGGIEYDEAAYLYQGAEYPAATGYETELLLVESKADKKERISREAEVIGFRILELRKSLQVTDKKTRQLRPADFRDFVILVRSGSGGRIELFKSKLDAMGIPTYIESKAGYFSASEVQNLLNYIRVINNPYQDIPLYGVLVSMFGGLTEEEVAQVKSGFPKTSLYKSLRSYCEIEEASTLQSKVKQFLETLEKYRRQSVYCTVRELLERIVEEFQYLAYVAALPNGGKRKANVEMLFTKAGNFEKTSFSGLFQFVRYIKQLEKYEVDAGEADTLDENADVVRIMTIHKSKGLEFPVAFVAGLDKQFNVKDIQQRIILDMELGIGTDYLDVEHRVKAKTMRKKAVAIKMKSDMLAEELRVLYVAFTRAREKLILSGVVGSAHKFYEELEKQAIYNTFGYMQFISAHNYFHFILPAISDAEFKIKSYAEQELLQEELSEQLSLQEKQLQLEQSKADEGALGELEKQLSFQYPFETLRGLHTKTTVSELKLAAMADKDEGAFHQFEQQEEGFEKYVPKFYREAKESGGALRGSAVHKAMELLDFEGLLLPLLKRLPSDLEEYRKEMKALVMGNPQLIKEAIGEQLKRMVQEQRISVQYFELLSLQKLAAFVQSDLGYRMWAAQTRDELYKEQPFVLGISAKRLEEHFPEEEKVLIQGIVDVFFLEEDGYVLLDYKTDVVPSMSALWDRYETQIDYYREALERLTGRPVKEALLYSFCLEEFGTRESCMNKGE